MNTQFNLLRYKRPPRKRPGAAKSGFALRLEGSLAAVVPLAPVIPIFPDLALLSSAKIEITNSKI